MDDIVIVAAARTPVGSFNGALGHGARACAGRHRDAGRAGTRRGGPRRRRRSDPRPGAGRRRGPEPRPPGARAAGMPDSGDRLRHQPGLRLRPAGRGAGRPADPHRREQHRRRRRHGKHEPVAARRAICATVRRWAGWSSSTRCSRTGCGTRSTATTWAPRRRTSRPNTRSPARSRTSSRWQSQQKASAAQKSGRFKDEIVPVTIKGRQGRHGRQRRRVHPP